MTMRLVSVLMTLACAGWLDAQDLGPAKNDPSVPKDRETILRIQIFLDREMFCPGKVDGAIGEFTYKGVVNYNFSHGVADVYDWTRVIEDAYRAVPVLYAAFKMREDLLKFVDAALPAKPEEQQGSKYMSYRSVDELIAERFHTDETFLAALNPNKNLATLAPGQIVYVPNLKPFKIEDVPKSRGFKEDAVLSRNTVVIDTKERMGAIYDPKERMLAAFPITPGKPQFIPIGDWKIVTMVTTPTFRWDKQFLEQGERGDVSFAIPPGPNSPVGILWSGISKSGIGLHGTASPRTIGRAQSAGCVRFANWDAIRLPTLVRPGSKVIVR